MVSFLVLFSVAHALPRAFVAADDQDFLEHCPVGWIETDVDECLAPLSYTGPCSTKLKVAQDLGAAGKKSLSDSCSVTWTSDTCEMNFEDSACPIGWTPTGEDTCEPPLSLDGACAATEKLAVITEKRDLAARCGSVAAYPCMEPCMNQDYAQPCPQGWLRIDGYCVAPASYHGPCLPFQNLAGFGNEDKRSWAKACQVQFPCQPEASEEDVACENANSCPSGWKLVGQTIEQCKAGNDYEGPCRPVMALAEIKQIGIRRFAAACSVTWPECAQTQTLTPEIVQKGKSEISPTSAAVAGPIADDGRLFVVS